MRERVRELAIQRWDDHRYYQYAASISRFTS